MEQKSNRKCTIMVVDDSPTILKIIDNVLNPHYTVLTFLSAQNALLYLQKNIPDLILLDATMPVMDGFAMLKFLKKNPDWRDIPVVFLTSKHGVDLELDALSMGAVDYICKPFSTPLLLKRLELHLEQSMRCKELMDSNAELRRSLSTEGVAAQGLQHAIIHILADLLESRDISVSGHITRTRQHFQLLLNYLTEHQLYEEELRDYNLAVMAEASQLHDIGKAVISDTILLKPSTLTNREMQIMQTHTTVGKMAIQKALKLTRNTDVLELASVIVYSHHERWDGAGYPSGLHSTAIPLPARMMAIVDVFDALVSPRPYRSPISHKEAVSVIREGRGTHFDPVLVDAFVASQKA